MAAELTHRLNDARQASPNLWPRTIALSTRQGKHIGSLAFQWLTTGLEQGWSVSQRKQAPFPFVRNVTLDVVSAAGDKLWKELVGPLNSTKPLSTKITHISLSFHGVEAGEANQRGIEGFLSKAPDSPSGRKRKVNSDDEEVEETIPTHERSEPIQNVDYFVCDRCKRRMTLPQELVTSPEPDEEMRRDALESLIAEHQDFHFAQDLSRMPSDDELQPERRKPTVQPKKKRKQKSETARGEGIARFFSKR